MQTLMIERMEPGSSTPTITAAAQRKRKNMKILIACEESQAVCIEMRRLGHEAYSCDIQEPSGGHPEWHILGNAQVYGNAKVYVELVDCVIRIFDYLGNEGADVEAIMAEKCAYNETRPYRHGKKF